MKYSYLLIILYFMPLVGRARSNTDSLSMKNGTYQALYRYKNNTRIDTSYLRILFINDTTFVYTKSGAADSLDKEADLNFFYHAIGGIGRLKYYNHKRIWVALDDYSGIFGDSLFKIGTEDWMNYEKAFMNYKLDSVSSINTYLFTAFQFTNDSIHLLFLNDCCHAIREGTEFKKIDNKKLQLSVDKNLVKYDSAFAIKNNRVVKRYVVRHNYSHFQNKQVIVKKNGFLTPLPIPERSQINYISTSVEKGDTLLVSPFPFFNYVLVEKQNKNDSFSVEKAGWILKQYLREIH